MFWQALEMTDEPENLVVAVVRYGGRLSWYRSDPDLWVLDVEKWRSQMLAAGYDVPEFNDDFRFGVRVVNAVSAPKFLAGMSEYLVDKDRLSFELASRFPTAQSWWDVKDLFPAIFVDFDRQSVGTFYADGASLELYVPDGWNGHRTDFAVTNPESVFPRSEKFWIKGDSDLLELLNERGKQLSKKDSGHFKD